MVNEAFKTPHGFEQLLAEAMAATQERARDAAAVKAAVILLAAPALELDASAIAAMTGYDRGLVQMILHRLQAQHVLCMGGLTVGAEIEWQRFGQTAVRIHALVGLGLLVREPEGAGFCYSVQEGMRAEGRGQNDEVGARTAEGCLAPSQRDGFPGLYEDVT